PRISARVELTHPLLARNQEVVRVILPRGPRRWFLGRGGCLSGLQQIKLGRTPPRKAPTLNPRPPAMPRDRLAPRLPARPRRLGLERLEDRVTPTTFTVNTALDDVTPGDGKLSLREAVTRANAHAGADVIVLPAGVFKLTRAGTGEDAN